MTEILATIAASIVLAALARAGNDGDYLYRVETIRAAPGKLEALLNWAAGARAPGHFEAAGSPFPFILRHSRGDQLDLLVILPMQSWAAFHSRANEKKRAAASKAHRALLDSQKGLIAFEEDVFA